MALSRLIFEELHLEARQILIKLAHITPERTMFLG